LIGFDFSCGNSHERMKSVEEARTIILSAVRTMPSEQVPLLESHRRVLAEDIAAKEDVPSFDHSSMDGFALRAEDTLAATETTPVFLHLAGEVAAGERSLGRLIPQTAVRIMTGAPIPPGADAVLQLEAVYVQNGSVRVDKPVSVGTNVRRKGEELRAGTTVLKRGDDLRASHLALLALLGVDRVNVIRKPSVAFLATGNELVEVDEQPQPGQLRNSNSYALWGLIREAGAEPVSLGTVRDDEGALYEKLQAGLAHDVLITSGGVSVGAYDYVVKTLLRLGVQQQFWKVNIKPGKPLFFGIFSNRERTVPVFGLPGNPVSTIVSFLQFVRPALLKMTGRTDSALRRLQAVFTQDYQKQDGRRHLLRGVLRNENNRLIVHTTGMQSSAALSSMVNANCLIVIPEETMHVKAGEEVEVELLG
jgi:molybdopterin molybdotransferase